MNEEVQKIRKRLQDLQDLRTTGFVDDNQYAESRAFLERKLIEVVLKDAAKTAAHADADFAETQLLPSRTPEASARPPRPRGRWLPWLVVAVLVPVLAVVVYWWASAGPSGTAVVPAKPVQDASAQQGVGVLEAAPLAASTAAATIETAPVATPSASPAGTSISGTVTLASALAQRARPADTVFVYARAVDGPPLPLAVIRKQVKDLPISFKLDDSMATWPTAKVSGFANVIVTARVSRSGEGQARDGDLQGQSAPVSAGTAGLQIEIDTVVKK